MPLVIELCEVMCLHRSAAGVCFFVGVRELSAVFEVVRCIVRHLPLGEFY